VWLPLQRVSGRLHPPTTGPETGAWVPTMHDDRPWGSYDVVDAGPGFQVKRLVVKPGRRFSYQRHRSRSEHRYVVAGGGIVTLAAGATGGAR
jgi:quercetin dioxygenase-like cupin family protein